MAELMDVLEYGSPKDFVPICQLIRILKARGSKDYPSVKKSLPRLRELIGTDHRVRLVLHSSQYRLRLGITGGQVTAIARRQTTIRRK
jgi:hypothetical protein